MFIFPAVSSGSAAYLIEQSLLFNDNDSAYLNRTPSSAGNRKTWTYSVWFKTTVAGTTQHFFGAGDGTTNNATRLQYQSTGTIQYIHADGGSVTDQLQTTALFLDPSAWYHMVVAVDTTQATDTNRVKLYINGSQVTSFQTTNWPSLNMETDVNNTNVHTIGTVTGSANFFDGLMALPILVDGVALAPSAFGETDDDGYWNPIEFDATAITDAAPTVTFIGTNTDNTNNNSVYTFSGQAIGTANANRQVILAINGKRSAGAGLAINSCTIGGVTARVLVEEDSIDAQLSAFVIANVPSGTTGDIVITFNSNSETCAIGVYTTVIENPVVWATAQDSGSPTLVSATLNTPTSNGFALACVTQTDGGNDASCVFTGVTEDADLSYDTNQGFAIGSATVSAGSLAISGVINTNGNNNRALSCIHVSGRDGFGPNGFQLDFADTTFFGKDSATTATATASTSGAWAGDTANTTFNGDDIDHGAATAIYAAEGLTGDFEVTGIQVDNATGYRFGVYDAAEQGTFNSANADGGLKSMTNSALIDGGNNNYYSGSTNDGGSPDADFSNGTTITIKRVGSTILAINPADGSIEHTFTSSWSGTTNIMFGNTNTNFDDISWTDESVGVIGNNYYDSGFTTSDQLEDSPTSSADDGIGNYITLNPNDRNNTSLVLTEGNTYLTASGDGGIKGTIFVDSGEHHFEYVAVSTTTNNMSVGITLATSSLTNETPTTGDYAFNIRNGTEGGRAYDIFSNGTTIATGSLPAAPNGENIGVVFDADAGTLKFYNSNLAASGDLIYTISSIPAGAYTVLARSSNNTHIFDFNFGQRPFVDTNLNNANAIATQNLPDDHPLYTGTAAQYRVGAPIINPFTDLPNAVHGWRADLGLTLTGSSVDQWDDQIGSWNLVDGGTKPTVLSSNINGLDAISFPGDGGNLSVSGVTLTMPYTVLMVMKQITWMIYGYPFGVFTQKGLQQRSSSPSLMQGDNLANTNSAATVGSYFPIMAEFGNTTSDFLHIGDTRVGGTASGNSSLSSSSFMLGAAQSSPPSNRSANVAYAEFIIVEGAMSEFDLANYRAYVKDRYGV